MTKRAEQHYRHALLVAIDTAKEDARKLNTSMIVRGVIDGLDVWPETWLEANGPHDRWLYRAYPDGRLEYLNWQPEDFFMKGRE